MLVEILSILQSLPAMKALRASHYVYPFVNAAHIAGLALLFGSILPMDLRLIGFWPSMSIGMLARVLVPVAVSGFVLAVLTGSLLFSVNAVEYAGTMLFQIKLILILCALANALLLRRAAAWTIFQGGVAGTTPRLQAAGVLSIALWLTVIAIGRWLGYL